MRNKTFVSLNFCFSNTYSLRFHSRVKNKWDYKGLEIIASHWNLRDAASEILTFSFEESQVLFDAL